MEIKGMSTPKNVDFGGTDRDPNTLDMFPYSLAVLTAREILKIRSVEKRIEEHSSRIPDNVIDWPLSER